MIEEKQEEKEKKYHLIESKQLNETEDLSDNKVCKAPPTYDGSVEKWRSWSLKMRPIWIPILRSIWSKAFLMIRRKGGWNAGSENCWICRPGIRFSISAVV